MRCSYPFHKAYTSGLVAGRQNFLLDGEHPWCITITSSQKSIFALVVAVIFPPLALGTPCQAGWLSDLNILATERKNPEKSTWLASIFLVGEAFR